MTASDAAVAALVSHLSEGLSGTVRVTEGWPENADLRLVDGPLLAVLATGNLDWKPTTPELLSSTVEGSNVTGLYRIATGVQSFQLSLFTAYQEQLKTAAAGIEPLLDNLFPASSGLILSTEYHGLPVRFAVKSASTNEQAGPLTGEWRVDWMLSARLDQVKEHTWPLQLSNSVELSTL